VAVLGAHYVPMHNTSQTVGPTLAHFGGQNWGFEPNFWSWAKIGASIEAPSKIKK
jgi:hypothetical protein